VLTRTCGGKWFGKVGENCGVNDEGALNFVFQTYVALLAHLFLLHSVETRHSNTYLTYVSGHVGHLGDASGVVGDRAVSISSEGDGEDGEET